MLATVSLQHVQDAMQQQRMHAPQPWEESAKRWLRVESVPSTHTVGVADMGRLVVLEGEEYWACVLVETGGLEWVVVTACRLRRQQSRGPACYRVFRECLRELRRHVTLKSLHLGGQPVTLPGDVRQPRLAVAPVLVDPGQTGLEVAVGGLRADGACLPRFRPLLVHPLLHHRPLPPPPHRLRLLRPPCPLPRGGRTRGFGGGVGPVSPSGRPFRLRVGGGSSSSTSMTSATTPIFRCLPTWTRMASHATSTHSGLRCSQPVSTFSPQIPGRLDPPKAQWGRGRRCGGCPAPPATPTPNPTRH